MKVSIKYEPGTGLEQMAVLKWSDRTQIVWSPF
jgi:hypothetical protein